MTKRPTNVVQFPGWRSAPAEQSARPTAIRIADLANVMIALRNEPNFAVAFAFDEMLQAVDPPRRAAARRPASDAGRRLAPPHRR